MVEKIHYKTLYIVAFLFSVMIIMSDALADNKEVNTVTAVVKNEEILLGSHHLEEKKDRGRSHFPNDPESFKPIPFPESAELSYQGEDGLNEQKNEIYYHNLISGEKFIYNSLYPGETTRDIGSAEENWEPDTILQSTLGFSDLTKVSNPSDYPWSPTVKLFVTFPEGEGTCSGTLIDPKHVLTAGHCVHNHDLGGDAIEVAAVPAYDAPERPYGDAWGEDIYVFVAWALNRDREYDIAAVSLDRPVGAKALAGWHIPGWTTSCSFFTDKSHIFHQPGYPGEIYDGGHMYNWYGTYDFCDFSDPQYGRLVFLNNAVAYKGHSGAGARLLGPGYWIVYAVLSSAGGTSVPLSHQIFWDIENDFVAQDTPSTFDLIPLFVKVAPSSISPGTRLSSMSYIIHNYSSASWSGKVDVDVYLSTNDQISTYDTRIQEQQVTATISDKGDRVVDVAIPPEIPVGTPDEISIIPDEGLNSWGSEGPPFSPSSKTYTLVNTGYATIHWTASNEKNWLTISPNGGTLASGESTTITLTINSNANSLTYGKYYDTVNITYEADYWIGIILNISDFDSDNNSSDGQDASQIKVKDINKSKSIPITLTITPDIILDVEISPPDGGRVTDTNIDCPEICSWAYPYGTKVTLTATPNDGYTFSSWENCDSTSDNVCEVTIRDYKKVTVTFASSSCTYSINPTKQTFEANGGTGSVSVTTQNYCSWTAVNNVSWITIIAGSSGSGNGIVNYSVSPNTGPDQRKGTMTIAEHTFTVTQNGAGTVLANLLLNPGFEKKHVNWTESSSGGYDIIWKDPSYAHTGTWLAYFGGYDTAVDYIYQDVTIPADTTQAYIQFWYWVGTHESTLTQVYDTLHVEIRDPSDNSLLMTLTTLSNLDETSGWVQSDQYDVMAFKGQTIRLSFYATTDAYSPTIFIVDDVALMAETSGLYEDVTLLSPDGGEVIPSGATYNVQWGGPVDAVNYKLKYSMDNGATWQLIDKDIMGMSYQWNVPVVPKNTTKCLVKVIGYKANGVKVGSDVSDAPFTIEVMRLVLPNGGETLTSNTQYTITWSTNDTSMPVEYIILKYTKNGGNTWKNITKLSGNPGSYEWLVPVVPKTKSKCKVKAILKDFLGNTVGMDISDNFFTIQP